MIGSSTARLDRALLFLYTLFVLGSSFSRALAQMSLGAALVVFLILVVMRKFNPFAATLKWFYIPAGLYLSWLVVANLMSPDPAKSIYAARKEWLLVAIPIGVYVFQNSEWRRRIFWSMTLAVGLFALYGCSEYLTGMDWLHFEGGTLSPVPITDTISGTLELPLTYATYYSTVGLFLLALALRAEGKWNASRWLQAGVAALALLAATLTLSRGPVIYVGLGLLVLAWMLKGKYRWAIIGALAVIALVSVAQPGMYERYRKIYEIESKGRHEGSRHFVWKTSLQIIADHPVFGLGNGNFMDEYRIQAGPWTPPEYIQGQAQNDLLNMAAIGGIPCAIFFAAVWMAVFGYLVRGSFGRKFGADQQTLCFAAFLAALVYFLNSLTDSTFAQEETHELAMVIWALGLAFWYNRGGSETTELST